MRAGPGATRLEGANRCALGQLGDAMALQGGTENDTAGWKELDLSGVQSTDGTEIPFRLVINRWKSSSPDSERAIHDPLTEFLEHRDAVDAFKAIDEDWHVTTLVVNHHQTLAVSHVYAMAAVATDEKVVGMTLVKKGK